MPEPLPFDGLAGVLVRQAHACPEAPALHFEGRSYSRAQLDHLHRAQAAWLRAQGIQRGDRVAWLGLNHAGQITLLFALARIGAVLVPLNFRLAPPEWDAVVADCKPQCVVHDRHWRDAARALALRHSVPAHAVDDIGGGLARQDVAPQHALPQNDALPLDPSPAEALALPVLLVYTSGTTGVPKGAVHTQANLLANMAAASQVQGITVADTVATVLPTFHVGGLCIQTLPALYAGARVLLHARFDADATLACFAQDRPTLTVLVPAVMKALVENAAWHTTSLSSLRAVWAGSSTLPQVLVDAFHARGVPVCNVYGATETGPFSVALDERHARSHPGACGWPAPGVQVKLVGVQDGVQDGTPDGVHGGVGEVLLRGPAVVRHYWPRQPAVDDEGWFHSGDLARQAADGSYTVVGRAKDMIISGGENIYPAEIENALAAHPAVAECAVLGVADERWGEAVVAAIVPRAGCTLDAAALQAWLGERVARYKLPRRFVTLAALPRTALGKVQKAQLLKAMQ